MDVEKHNLEQELERWMDAEFKKMPLIKAPSGFSDRVMADLACLRTRPWWQRPYQHWSAFHQAVFIIVSIFSLAMTIWNFYLYGESLSATANLPALSSARSIAIILFNLITTLSGAISLIIDVYKFWCLAFLAVAALLYAMGVGISAAGIAIATKSTKEIQHENCS